MLQRRSRGDPDTGRRLGGSHGRRSPCRQARQWFGGSALVGWPRTSSGGFRAGRGASPQGTLSIIHSSYVRDACPFTPWRPHHGLLKTDVSMSPICVRRRSVFVAFRRPASRTLGYASELCSSDPQEWSLPSLVSQFRSVRSYIRGTFRRNASKPCRPPNQVPLEEQSSALIVSDPAPLGKLLIKDRSLVLSAT